MFEQLFRKTASVIYHKAAPYADDRERFLEHLAGYGYAQVTLRHIAPVLVSIAHELKAYPDLKVSEEDIQAATRRATQMCSAHSDVGHAEQFREKFAREARRWLRFLGGFKNLR